MSSDSDSKHRGLQDLNTKMKLPQVFGPILTQDTSQKYLPDLKKLKMNKGSLSKEDCDDVSFVNENEIGLWYDQKYILGLLKKIPHG